MPTPKGSPAGLSTEKFDNLGRRQSLATAIKKEKGRDGREKEE